MSIYIPGMEMPDRCFSCPMNDTFACGMSRGSYIEYRDVEIDVAMDHRPDWCPLVPVPEHGRLIDADALLSHDLGGAPYKSVIRRVMMQAPTIIPADRSKALRIIDTKGKSNYNPKQRFVIPVEEEQT